MNNRSTPIKDRNQYPKLWFDDGNVVLTTSVSRFRVHRSVLSMSSPVLAGMLQPDRIRGEETYEGLPVFEINDNEVDFMHLLYFIYDRRYYQYGIETTFGKMSGLLRMSTKYQMHELRSEIIQHLALAYPTTRAQYLKAVDPKAWLPLFPPFHGQHFAVAALARQTNATVLLPAALWRSTCMTLKDILDGAVDSNGTKHRLCPADILRCTIAKSNVYKHIINAETALMNELRQSECARQDEKEDSIVSPCMDIATSQFIQYSISSGTVLVREECDSMTQAALGSFEVWRLLVCDSCR
ncbi:hypothetical protein BD410DRAFT_755186 [Rickenella mellea]|uniref:BTB domain-containing protein n=1 Tax=Rickenella mellea TaxID=50990 RepID=A0A4Y7PQ44_9AGAM|nr:hypothetical protein BD410DRAFT_755186 [Rickenella mellea]